MSVSTDLGPSVTDSPEVPGSFFTSRVLERISEPAEFIRILNATQRLSDSDFERSVHDLGYRVVTLYQRAGALAGNLKLVQSCEVYLKRAKECLNEHRVVTTVEPGIKSTPFASDRITSKSET